MTLLHWAIISPFLAALVIPLLYKKLRSIHTGWFVLILPAVLFLYFFQFISQTSDGKTIKETVEWMPSFGINFTAYVDGLSLLFALLITGIGTRSSLFDLLLIKRKRTASQFLCVFAFVYGSHAWCRPF